MRPFPDRDHAAAATSAIAFENAAANPGPVGGLAADEARTSSAPLGASGPSAAEQPPASAPGAGGNASSVATAAASAAAPGPLPTGPLNVPPAGGVSGPKAAGAVGMRLAQQFSAPLVRAGQERLAAAFQDDPVLTGILVGGAALVGIGAYVGYQASREGRIRASPSFDVGAVRLGVSGGYDFANGAWQGLVQVDLSRIVDQSKPDAAADAVGFSPLGSTTSTTAAVAGSMDPTGRFGRLR